MVATGYALDDKVPLSGATMTGTLNLQGTPPLVIPSGAAGGKIATSDASGTFSWTTLASLGIASASNATDWYNVVAHGADPAGVTSSDAVFAAMVANFQATGQPGYIPAGTYKISGTLNWKVPGLVVFTAGAHNTKITMATANTIGLELAGQGQKIGGLTVASGPGQQSSSATSAIGIVFGDDTVGSCFMSDFADLRVEQFAIGMAINPAVAVVAGLFSCHFGNIEVFGYSIQAVYWFGSNGGGANCTGCEIGNLYIHNNWTGSDIQSTSWPLELNGWDECVFAQLNIEHAEVFDSDACLFAHCGNIIINSFHIEHLEMSGNPGYGLVGVGTGTVMVKVDGLSARFMTFSGTSYNSVFRVTGGSGQNILLAGLKFPAGDGGDSTSAIALVDFNSATGVSAQLTGLDSTASQLWTTTYINAASGCSGVITDGSQVTYFPPLAWTMFPTGGMGNSLNVSSGSATVPAAGTWYYADLYIPFTSTITGLIVEAPAGPNSGTDKWMAAIWPGAGGTALANSATAGLTVPGSLTTAENFKIALTAPVTLPGPAVYKAAIQSNGTTAKIACFSNNVEGFATGSQAGTFGTVPALTPGGSYSQNLGPMLKTY